MASGGAEEDDGGIPLDIDNLHALLQVEHEQIQKRTFTNWINAQLSKRCPPSFVSDLFSDLKEGSRLLDLLEVMSGQTMRRQRGRGVFQQRANVETALNFLKKKSIKLVNINIPDIIDGRPSIILGLVWSIILHCHIEELANALSFSSRHSSLDSLSSLDSWSGSSIPDSPVPAGRTSPLHRRFRVSAKKALLMWVRDQCQKVNSSISVRDFKSSWRSGEAFLVILCSLRPQLVDLSLIQTRSNYENLEEAFSLAERELQIPRLLEPQDVDVKDPEEKSIMTYVAQFLQYSNDMPAPDDHLQVSSSERAQEVTLWLRQAYQELSESWAAAEESTYAEKYQVFQSLNSSFAEQKRPVMNLLVAMKRRPDLKQEESTLRATLDDLEEELQRCKVHLDLSLPPPVDSVVVWLQRAEEGITDDRGSVRDHAAAAREARAHQDTLKTSIKEMSHYVNIIDTYHNLDDSGNVIVPLEKFDEIKNRLTNFRVTAKYQGIKLEYQESRHKVLDLLGHVKSKVQSWRAPYTSPEATHLLLQDWGETVEHQNLVRILMDAVQNLKEKANVSTSKAALGEDYDLVTRQVKEAESEAELVNQAVNVTKHTMERVVSAWEVYNKSLTSLEEWLAHKIQQQTQSAAATNQDMSEWTTCHAQVNQAGNFLIEVTDTPTSLILADQLGKVNKQWAECMKKTMFEVPCEPSSSGSGHQMVRSLTQEANCLLRQQLEVDSVQLKANRQKLQSLVKKMAELEMSSLDSSPDSNHTENPFQTLPKTLAEAERSCGELQRAASKLEGHLAELDHWSTDATDFYINLKEKMHSRRSAMEPTAKVLISRGLQLMHQVGTEGRDLQDFVTRLQKTSPLQYFSTSGIQDRITLAVSDCQEILGKFSSLGFKQQVSQYSKNQPPSDTKQPKKGSFVLARTKHVDQIGNVMLQTQDPNEFSSQIPPQLSQQRARGLKGRSKNQHKNTKDEKGISVSHVVMQTISQPSRELIPPDEKEAESRLLMQSKLLSRSFEQVSSVGQKVQLVPAPTQTSVSFKCPSSPVLSKGEASSASSPSQSDKVKKIFRTQGQPTALQSNKSSKPPVMIRSEVHSKAQSMAKSRLEKARSRLQGHIQQAVKLFSGKDISESQAKKKQKALKILQPAVLEEFLGAVEGFGAFCSGPQLQDLMVLTDSVRKQWEDVRREMAAFIPLFWSQVKEGKQSFSVVWCEMHTNTLSDATDQTDHGSLQLQQQVVTEESAPIEGYIESLGELCETLTASNSCNLAPDQLTESDETQASITALPAESRGRQLGVNVPLGATDKSVTQPRDDAPLEQSVDILPVKNTLSVQLHGDVIQVSVQDVPTERKDHLTENTRCRPEKILKSSLRAPEQLLKARLLHTTESNQQNQTHIQTVVRSDNVETKQEAERTVITEITAPPQDEPPTERDVLERYNKSRSAFQTQLEKNQLELRKFLPDPDTVLSSESQKKQLQTLKEETEVLWFNLELQYAQLSKFAQLNTSEEDQVDLKKQQKQLIQQWRDQQMCLQSRMASLESAAPLLESADDLKSLISEKLTQIISKSVDISSLTFADPTLLSDLQVMDEKLEAEMRKLSEHITKEGRQGPEATSPSSLCRALHSSVSHLERLRQQLERVQSATQDLDRFLATVREVKAQNPTILVNPGRERNEAEREREKRSWQAATLRLQADGVDSSLKAAGMTLTEDGVTVTCQDVVKSASKHTAELDKTLKQIEDEEKEGPTPIEIHHSRTWDSLPKKEGEDEESKRNKPEKGNEAQMEEEHKARTRKSKEDVLTFKDQRRRRKISQVKKEGDEKESLVRRKVAVLVSLRETKGSVERLGLQEATLPALQHRTRALTELERTLAALVPEVQWIRGVSSQSGLPNDGQSTEVENLWEETTKAVAERLDQCCILTELLKSFQSIRGELSGTLQRAESTISGQASYMGRDNVLRLHTTVQETKAELTGLGDDIEEIRSVCRQLHSHLRQIPECTSILFENEADSLMDRWLDLLERTDSHLENLHLALTLWDGVLQLGTDVESWTDNKLSSFTQCPSFQSVEDIKALHSEIESQEENLQHFHRRSTEIQSLLQSVESPLELQVLESQMRKKVEQLKELVSEAEDVYKQMEATKEQMTGRMDECFNSLQEVQDSLLTLGGPNVATVLSKLKELCWQLNTQDERAEILLEDVRVLASIARPENLESVTVSGVHLQEKVRKTQQLFSEVEEQTERNIQDLDRLQNEKEQLEQWLHAAEEKAVKKKDLHLLREEALQQRPELLSELVSSLRSSNLHQLVLLEESEQLLERHHSFLTGTLVDSKVVKPSLSRNVQAFRGLSRSTQSWIQELRQVVDSPLVERRGVQGQVEQRLRSAQIVLNARTEGEARLEELRVTGASVSHRLLNGDEVKERVQEDIRTTTEQWKHLLQSVEPHYRVLQADPELASSFLDRSQEVWSRLEELQRQTDQLPTLIPCAGNTRQAWKVKLQEESESLKLTLEGLTERRKELSEKTGDNVWEDSSWSELDTRWSALMAELEGVHSRLEEGVNNEEHFSRLLQDCGRKLKSLQESWSICQAQIENSTRPNKDGSPMQALLQEVSILDEGLLRLATLKDSIEVSSGLSQQLKDLQIHKSALESNIRDNLALTEENRDQTLQQIREKASNLNTALTDLADNVGKLSGVCEVSPDFDQLKHQWSTIQDSDARLTELATTMNDLQRTRDGEMLPADVASTISAVLRDFDSLKCKVRERNQECAKITAERVKEVIGQLQQWSQTVKSEPLSPDQAGLDEGLQHQQALYEVFSEQSFLLNCLGAKVTKKLEKSASRALKESQPTFETLSKGLVCGAYCGAQLENRDFLTRRDEDGIENEDKEQSSSSERNTLMSPPPTPSSEENSKSDHKDNKIQSQGTFDTDRPSELVTDESVTAEATNQEKGISKQTTNMSVMYTTEGLVEKAEAASFPKQFPFSAVLHVSESISQEKEQQTLNPDGSKDDALCSGTTPPINKYRPLSWNDTELLMPEWLRSSKKISSAQQGNTEQFPKDCTPAQVLASTDNAKEITSPHSVTSLIGSPVRNPGSMDIQDNENMPEVEAEQSETREPKGNCEDVGAAPKNVFTIELETEPQDVQQQMEHSGSNNLDALSFSPEAENSRFPNKELEHLATSDEADSKNDHLEAKSDIFEADTRDQKQERHLEVVSGAQEKVFTIVLDMKPQDIQESGYVGATSPDVHRCSKAAGLCDTKLTEVSTTGVPKTKSELFNSSVSLQSEEEKRSYLAVEPEFGVVTASPDKVFTIVLDMDPQYIEAEMKNIATQATGPTELSIPGFFERKSEDLANIIKPDLNKTHLKSLTLSSSIGVNTDKEEIKSASAKLPCKVNLQIQEMQPDERLASPELCGPVVESLLTGTHAAGTKDVKHEDMAEFCLYEEQTEGSLLSCSAEDSLQTGDALTETQIPAAHTAQTAGTAWEEKPEGENTRDNSTCTMRKHLKVPEIQGKASLPKEQTWSSSTAPEDKQLQIPESLESKRTVSGFVADMGAGEVTGGSPESCKHRSTMQDLFFEIESLVESSNIINRLPHIDLKWYLKSSPGEPEIRLLRTVQQVLACRYRPAQLSVAAMTKQVEEAEEYKRSVEEQVATMKSLIANTACDANDLKSAEGQWSAALLDTSATVQVKTAQLDQVKQYHRQMKIVRAFLEVLTTEKDKMTLEALGSSALQVEKHSALLQTLKQKKSLMEELLRLSSQLSVHLSDAESSGALLAQLGDVQEEWRLLEGSIKRVIRHTSNSTGQSTILLKEAQELKAKLEALQISNCQNPDSKGALEFVCLNTDLKLYHQIYLHLKSQSDAIINFSMGQKEKDEIERSLKGLESLLSVTKNKLDSFVNNSGSNFSTKINKQLQDLITWAKQAENHICVGNKLALFPEEARVQIAEMKKFQTDILSRRSTMREQIEEMKDVVSDTEKDESGQILKTVEDLYEAIADSLDHVLETMNKDLNEREKLLCELASIDAWLAETHANRDPCYHVENVSTADIRRLETELKSHKLATAEIEGQLNLVDEMSEDCRKIAAGLSPGESRYLVNRLSGLWTELDGLLSHEKFTSWELEELIHERTSSEEELSTIQASLKQISSDLEQQKFPLTQETHLVVARLKHMLMEHQCEVQEIQHCQEAKRSSVLCSIGELQDRCKALSLNAFEQEKYLHLKRQMEESRDIAELQIQHAKNKDVCVGERFRLCQTLLVEFPLIKTQCQETADQLETIAQELDPSELESERQRIHCIVETLVSWENNTSEDIKSLESKLLLGLRFNSELPALMELLESTRAGLGKAKPVNPEEKAIDSALQHYWLIWRNMESGMRVLEGLGRKEKIKLKNYKNLYSLCDAVMQECHSHMVSLSQARESLKDYQWAAQGAIGFLYNAEATFLSAPGGFLDCAEEQQQTQQALEVLEDGFQAHICHLVERVPQQSCLCHQKTEQLHISILSQLIVGRAVLEAQAQLRLETLQRCEVGGQSHRKCHEATRQHLSGFEAQLSECAAEQVTSYKKCIAQQRKAQLLMADLRSLAGKLEDLRAGCPMQGCGVGKDGEVGALWRRWVSFRRGVGLLMAHTEQRGEEWKEITASMEQCCSFLASLQAEVPDSSAVSFTRDEPQELLAQAEMHQAGLEQEQQALASLEHRLEHALSLTSSLHPPSPGPVGKTLVKIQEDIRSLKERNMLVVAAAQAEAKERRQVQEEVEEVEKHVFSILQALEECSEPSRRQKLKKDLSSQTSKLKCITDGLRSRYADIPADIERTIHDVQLSLRGAEEKFMEKDSPVWQLSNRVTQLGSGLEKVKALLEKRSPTVSEAQKVLKNVWDELDTWHSSLMLLESEVQDLAEERPDQAQILIDHLTHPQQLYQNAAQMAEHRTAFLNRIPAGLQEFEDVLYSASCWLDEAQSWLSGPSSFTTAKSIQNYAKSLQLVTDDSARLRHNLQAFRSVLAEISCVCDMSAQEKRLDQKDLQVQKMQSSVLRPLEQLLHAAAMVEAMEVELKTIEKNISKSRTILSSVDVSHIPLTEHLHNRQVILANVQSMRKTLEEIERCKGELHLPEGAEESLLVFSRTKMLLQPLEELESLTQEQVSQLQMEEERDPSRGLYVTSVSDAPEATQRRNGSPDRQLVQEAFEMSNSEDDDDEEDESYHSSSSDTLTCSIPEDLEETFNSEEMAAMKTDVQELERSTHQFSVERSSKDTKTVILPGKPGLNTNFGSEAVESIKLHCEAGRAFIPETATAESVKASEAFKEAATEQQEPPRLEPCRSDARAAFPQATSVEEDTRLVPSRPKTPFSSKRASDEFPSTRSSEFTARHGALVEGSEQLSSEVSDRLAENDKVNEKWTELHSQICERLAGLRKIRDDQQTGADGSAEKELLSPGSACAVLQQTHESITMFRQIMSDRDGSPPGMKEDLYEAVRRVICGLDALNGLLVTPGDPQIRPLQQECLSNEVATLADLISKVESKVEPDVSRCLTSLEESLHTARLLLTSSHQDQEVGNKQPELPSHPLCLLDEFEFGQNKIFPSLIDVPHLECVLGRHLRERPGEKAELQHACGSLLRGIAGLLAQGEECMRERKTRRVHNCSKLQAVLCRDKKLLQVLASQSAFVQRLFRGEPGALRCREEERLQLESRAKALQRQALEQDAASQRRIQEWTRWEGNCGQLGRVLDESEAFISSGEPEGDDDDDDDDEEAVQQRLDACQQTLVQLDEARATLGLLLDLEERLQAEPSFSARVGETGGALELRWRSVYDRTEQEIRRCRGLQDSRARFQTDFSSLTERLVAAKEHLKDLSSLAESSEPNQESVGSSLIKLLDVSMEVEAMSLLKTSLSKTSSQLLRLKDSDSPELTAQVDRLEDPWSQVTCGLTKTQEQLQQCLLPAQPSKKLLSDLQDWLKTVKSRLSQEKEQVFKAKNAAEINELLHHYQEVKAALTNGQLLLDFLSQPRPQMMAADVQALRSERTTFAEKLGDCRLEWIHLQGELDSQITEADQMRQTCIEREGHVRRLQGWIKQQRKQLDEWKRPTSQTLARKTLLEWEDMVDRVKEVAAALQELKSRRAHEEKNKELPFDLVIYDQAERLCHDCEDLSQQMEAARPSLQQTVEDWRCFDRHLSDVILNTTRGRCALQHQQAPFFSLEQAEGYLNFLQQLQVKVGKDGELLEAMDESHRRLVEALHPRAAQALKEQVEEERKRWNEMLQEIKDERMNTEKTVSLWQKYSGLSDRCSQNLQRLQHQWEELSGSSATPEQDTRATLSSVKKFQDDVEGLQSELVDVLEASKPLIGRLEPPTADLIQSEARLLSRDILLLKQVVSVKTQILQENSEQMKLFHIQLEVLEKQSENLLQKLKAGGCDKDSVEPVLLELSDLFPSLVDIRETSSYVILNKQETDRLHSLSRQWVQSRDHTADALRGFQAERQSSQSFQEMCDELKSIQEKINQESVCKKPASYSSAQEMMRIHQRLQADVTTGQELLQGLLRDAVKSLEKETGVKRSKLVMQVAQMKASWFKTVTLTDQNRTLAKDQLHQWKIYHGGLKLLRKLLRDIDSLLPPTGHPVCTVHPLLNSSRDCQCVEKSLELHYPVYTQTLEAGKRLCEATTESESQSRLQSELQDIEEAWDQTSSLLRKRRDHVNATVQMWSQCQDGITNVVSELDELKKKQPEGDASIQETELSLQHLAGRLRELATMKTDLSQYVAASDSALLEQQLEQLHIQWEELCMKVSLRRQEIADRLNAWTIFNDKNREFCDWLTQMENKVCHSGDLSIEEMVEKLKKDCMEEINLFSENKSHLKHLGEQLLLASDQAKQSQVHGSLQEVNQRWNSLFHHIEARVKKLKETLVTMQQLDKNMSNLRSWLSRMEADLSRPVTYSVCHQQEIQKRLAEQQELQRDIEQHTEGVASVLSLCDVLLRDEDAAGGTEVESDSLQETSRSLDQRWRTICALALDRRLRIEETWTLWCKFLNDYSRFEDWLKMAERTAANPNSADVLFTVAKEELKKFEGFQRQVHERLTQLELVNNQYRRLARENRTDRASKLRAMVHEGNQRWDTLHRRVAAIIRRLKYFTSQREEFEGTRESMLVWLTELDLQLTNVEHFSESDVHHKIQQLNGFQKEITLNTERIDGLIVFGEGLIQRSSPQDAALIEDELEELHSYCQEVFSRLVRFHQRLSQPTMIKEEPELSGTTSSLESSLELIGRLRLGRSLGSLPATPTHLLTSPLERSGRETPVSVDSLPLEWDHTGDVGGSSSHEDDEEEEDHEDKATYFSALSEVELAEIKEEFTEALESLQGSSMGPSRSIAVCESPRWRSSGDTEEDAEAPPTLTSTPLKEGYLRLMSQCSGSIENLKRVSLMLDDEEQPEEFGLTGLSASDKPAGVIERWELFQARSRHDEQADHQEPPQVGSDLHNITSWLEDVIPELERLQRAEPAGSIEDMEARAKELKEMHKIFAGYKSIMLSVNLRAEEDPELQERMRSVNKDWSRACTSLQQWDTSLRNTMMRSQEFHETLHSLLLWLAHAESRRYAVDISRQDATATTLLQHRNTLNDLWEELQARQSQQASLQALWCQLQPEEEGGGGEDSDEAREKLHVTGSKLKLLLRQVEQDLSSLQQRLDCDPESVIRGQNVSSASQEVPRSKKASSTQRERRESTPPRSFFHRVLRAAFPLHLLLLLLLLLPCLIPMSESDASCTVTNNFARSFYPMLHYTNGPPPT